MYRQKHTISVMFYMTFKEEIYFAMFLRNIFLTCHLLNFQNLTLRKKSCLVCWVSCLTSFFFFDVLIFIDLHLIYLFSILIFYCFSAVIVVSHLILFWSNIFR